MKRVFLVMVVSAMLVTLGFAQTPDAGSNTNPASVKGCLGGSDGNYTVVEDGTGQIFNHALFASPYTKASGTDTSINTDINFT